MPAPSLANEENDVDESDDRVHMQGLGMMMMMMMMMIEPCIPLNNGESNGKENGK